MIDFEKIIIDAINDEPAIKETGLLVKVMKNYYESNYDKPGFHLPNDIELLNSLNKVVKEKKVDFINYLYNGKLKTVYFPKNSIVK